MLPATYLLRGDHVISRAIVAICITRIKDLPGACVCWIGTCPQHPMTVSGIGGTVLSSYEQTIGCSDVISAVLHVVRFPTPDRVGTCPQHAIVAPCIGILCCYVFEIVKGLDCPVGAIASPRTHLKP